MRLLLILIGLAVTMMAAPARAGGIDVYLYGSCAGIGQCVDNGTNSPTTSTSPTFGFTSNSGPITGPLFLDILVPDNDLVSPPFGQTYTLTGTASATASLAFSRSSYSWTSGTLQDFMGYAASSYNDITRFLPATQTVDSGATGYYVFQATFNSETVPDLTEIIGQSLPVGSYILGHIEPNVFVTIETADDGAIFIAAPLTTEVPEPGDMAIFATGLLALATLIWCRRSV